MFRLLLLLPFLSSLASAGRAAGSGSPRASLTIDPAAPSVAYSRNLFGGFLEHFDNQIYGGVFEPGSPRADAAGFRLDVLAALRELRVPVIRWPGGCFVDAYDWRKGVGRTREPHGDFRWGVVEPNTFGTDEFVELCRRVGAEPYLCLNGLAPVQENLDWVAYCNATEGALAELRRANGHADPFHVKFWSVGNERYDREYVNRVRDTARAMKALGADLQVSCAGSQGGEGRRMPGINAYLLEQAGGHLDYVSVHNYWLPRAATLLAYDYLTAILRSELPEAYIGIVAGCLRQAGLARIRIAFDEWNLRAWQHPGFPRDQVADYGAPAIRELVERRRRQNDEASQYTMADALFSASFLNACLRHADEVRVANVAPLVNTRGPLFVHAGGIVKRTHFHTLALYANELESRVGRAELTADRLERGAESIGVVDAVATVDETGRRWVVALVNRHPEQSVACTVRMGPRLLEGGHPATVLAGDSPDAFNDVAHPDRVAPVRRMLAFTRGVTRLPPHSLTIVRLAAE